ncbi:MAG: hypothetical protein UY07_C0028G0008 [Parcubacteria group bacterium GW2011_GWA1_47_8]|nr:MAG: hypothetical protein UY07_C0028G0008 [Parcubacteria group bacterium GW2011_GWA1_47_8]
MRDYSINQLIVKTILVTVNIRHRAEPLHATSA